jgi:putative sigma-54 modulation protein
MNIDFTARRVNLNPKVREIVEKRLAKLSKVLPSDAQAHVIVRAEKLGVSVEITIVGRQGTWTATEVGDDQEKASYAVLERISAQAKKSKGKSREEKKHRASAVQASTLSEVIVEKIEKKKKKRSAEPRVGARHEKVAVRPMFEEDALNVFTGGNREILVFRDPANDALRVLYRRRDGSLGLVIPT